MRWQRNLWWFAVPSFVLLGAVMLYPFASAVYLSLFDYYLIRPDDAAFVGLANYVSLLADARFWSSLLNTFIIAGGAVALEFALGLAVALGLFHLRRGAGAFIFLQLVPLVITPVVAALFIKWIFVARWGLIDAGRGEDMNVRTTEEIEQRGTPTALEMAAGDVLFLTNLTFHTSRMNHTDASRWSVDFRYHAPPEVLSGSSREAIEELRGRQRGNGRVPLPALSAAPVPTWEEWQAATQRQRQEVGR